jgi:hypothetical protein
MRQRHTRWATCWLGLGALVLSLAAWGQTATTVYGPFSINSTSGMQLSNVLYPINTSTAGLLLVQYNASAGHCSDVRVHILVDGTERALSAFLAPGQSSGFLNVGPVAPGAHVVALQAEGRVGGCNAGFLLNWGGTAQVTVDGVAAAAVPAPGVLPIALVVLGATAVLAWRRRRSQ